MDKDILKWMGNAINFLIIVYLIVTNVITDNFDFFQGIIAIFGLFISIIIQLYNLKNDN